MSRKWLSLSLLALVAALGCSVLVLGGDKTARQFAGQTYFVIELNLEHADLELFWKDSSQKNHGSFDEVKNALERQGRHLIFATNAGMFDPERQPVGLHVENGKELRPLDLRTDLRGNFYLMPNGVFFVTKDNTPGIVETTKFQKNTSGTLKLATQSGPMLVIASKIHPAFNPQSTSRFIRSGVGITGKKKLVFAISDQPVTFHEFARFFLEHFECPEALYLDGAISHFHAPEFGHSDQGLNFGGILAVSRKK